MIPDLKCQVATVAASTQVKDARTHIGQVIVHAGNAVWRLRDGGPTGTPRLLIFANASVPIVFHAGIEFQTDLYVDLASGAGVITIAYE